MSAGLSIWIIGAALGLFAYTYLGYPFVLWLIGERRNRRSAAPSSTEWPRVSISVPVYNERAQIRELIESLLAIDYPRDRLQTLIVSDGSDDGTDEIVEEYRGEGIELLRLSQRGGKTRAEAAAAQHLSGEVIVNTDASIRIAPGALRSLVAAFSDDSVGLASGRDVSVAADEAESNAGEQGYVGYEMMVRDLETRAGGIIGASGCFYAIRADLHRLPLPEELSRDFAAALNTTEHGLRAVSVNEATCVVPRTASLHSEYRRKVRTITRGMETLWHKRSLLDPFRYGRFAWMLISHKVFRWALPWAALAAYVALGRLALDGGLALLAFAAGTVVLLLGAVGWWLSDRMAIPSFLRIPAFLLAGNVAAAHALVRVVMGRQDAIWEPTRRGPTSPTT